MLTLLQNKQQPQKTHQSLKSTDRGLGCKNAYIVMSNLPPLIALLDLLNVKRRDDDDRERWRREYLIPWQRLTAILSSLEPETISGARERITPELQSQVWDTVIVNRGES
ncbi:hypothetical protein E3G68_005334 [Mycobacteroides abscessus]|nr:hypothetical protein [Mycobacteroides abscessus]